MALDEKQIKLFKINYPILGKKWCINNIGMSDGQVRHYAQKFKLPAYFKFNKESNYNRGSRFRGKKRPEHSKYLKEHHPLKGKHHKESTRLLISKANQLAHQEGRLKADNFTGHHHTEESRKKISLAGIGRIKTKKSIEKMLKTKMEKYGKVGGFANVENNYSRCKRGYYDIGGEKIYFRSMWEANYALYLNFLIKKNLIKSWEFEKDTFWFEKIRRGVRSYTPDFKILNNNNEVEYHEVKGWMDKKSITKIKRMQKYYPKIKLIVIDQHSYSDIKKKVGRMLKFYE